MSNPYRPGTTSDDDLYADLVAYKPPPKVQQLPRVTVTAKADKAVQDAILNGDPDRTRDPLAQSKFQTASDYHRSRIPEDVQRLARKQQAMRRVRGEVADWDDEFLPQFVRGAAESAFPLVQLGAKVVDALPGVDGLEDRVRNYRKGEFREFYGDPRTTAGTAGQVLGMLGGTAAQFMLPGAALGRVAAATDAAATAANAGRAIRALNTIAKFGRNPLGARGLNAAGEVNVAGRIASGTVLGAIPNTAMAASKEDAAATGFAEMSKDATSPTGRAFHNVMQSASESPLGRQAVEHGFDLLAGGAGEAVFHLAPKGFRAARDAARINFDPARPDAVTPALRYAGLPEGELPTITNRWQQRELVPTPTRQLEVGALPADAVQVARQQLKDATQAATDLTAEARRAARRGDKEAAAAARAEAKVAQEAASKAAEDLRQAQLVRQRARRSAARSDRAAAATASEAAQGAAARAEANAAASEAQAGLAEDLAKAARATDEESAQGFADAAQRASANAAQATEQGQLARGVARAAGRSARGGFVDPAVLASLSGSTIGGTAGVASGEDDQDKMLRGLMGAGIGLAGGGMMGTLASGARAAYRSFPETLYSRTGQLLQNSQRQRGVGQAWLNTLRNAPREELEYTGLAAFLRENIDREVQRQQVEQVLLEGTPRLRESVYGTPSRDVPLDQALDAQVRSIAENARRTIEALPRVRAIRSAKRRQEVIENLTHEALDDLFSKLVAGGDDSPLARTLGSMSVPQRSSLALQASEHATGLRPARDPLVVMGVGGEEAQWDQWRNPVNVARNRGYREIVLRLDDPRSLYDEGHFDFPSLDETNSMMHVRLSERVVDGKKVLVVEEVQDDWAQAARTKDDITLQRDLGADYASMDDLRDQLTRARETLAQQQQSGVDVNFMTAGEQVRSAVFALQLMPDDALPKGLFARGKILSADEMRAGFDHALGWLHGEMQKAVAAAPAARPFLDTASWSRLALKRVLEEAAVSGADSILLSSADMIARGVRADPQKLRSFYEETLPKVLESIGREYGQRLRVRIVEAPEYAALSPSAKMQLRALKDAESAHTLAKRAADSFETPKPVWDAARGKYAVPPEAAQKRAELLAAKNKAAIAFDQAKQGAEANPELRNLLRSLNSDPRVSDAENMRGLTSIIAPQISVEVPPAMRERILTQGQSLFGMAGVSPALLAQGAGSAALGGGAQAVFGKDDSDLGDYAKAMMAGSLALPGLRAMKNKPEIVQRFLDLTQNAVPFFREVGDDVQALTRTLAEFRAASPIIRRAAEAAGDAREVVDDVLRNTREAIEGRIDRILRREGPLAKMMDEVKGVKSTTVEDASKLAEQDTAMRLQAKGVQEPVDLSNATPVQRATRAIRLGMEDMREAIERFGRDASEWYSKQGRQASAQMQILIPELQGNPGKRFIADVILAITSSGATVEDNLARAIPIIKQWLETGQITQLDVAKGVTNASDETIIATGKLTKGGKPERRRVRSGVWRDDLKGTTRAGSIETGLRKLQLFLDANGGDERAVQEFLGQTYTTKGNARNPSRSAPMSAETMGPKIGRFLLNLQGMGDEVTVDTWALRTWMRWMGYGDAARFEKIVEDLSRRDGTEYTRTRMGLRGGPNDAEKVEIRNAFEQLARTVSAETGKEFRPADVQALLWYLEKYNYAKWGSKSDLVSFADVGDRFVMEGMPKLQNSNVAGTDYKFRFGVGETSGLDKGPVREMTKAAGMQNKVYSFPAQLGDVDWTSPAGRKLAGQVGLVGGGLLLRDGAEDERLRMTGTGLIGLGLGSAVYPYAKAGVKAGAKGLAERMAQSENGRLVLNAISRDILTDPRIKTVVEAAAREQAQFKAIGQELAALSRRLGPEGDRVVSDLVEGENFANHAALSKEDMEVAAALATRIADAVQGLGQAKVREGLISEATQAKRARTYLRRQYARFDAEDAAEDVVVQGRGKTYRIEGERIRNDALTPEERNAMGEIREASYRLAETFGRGGRDIASARLFNALLEMPGVVHPDFAQAVQVAQLARGLASGARSTTTKKGAAKAAAAAAAAVEQRRLLLQQAKDVAARFPEAPKNGGLRWLQSAGGDYVRLPDNPQLGVMRGAVVRADVADYLMDLPDLRTVKGQWGQMLALWKKIHTVYNTGTHIGNFLSNIGKAHMGGFSLSRQMQYMPGAISDWKNYGPATRYLTEAGVLDRALPLYGDVATKRLADDRTALRQLSTTTRPETRAALDKAGIKPMSKMEQGARALDARIVRAYAAEDAVFKIGMFQRLTDQGMAAEEALAAVRKTFPEYTTRSPILGALKNTVSPFILYSAKYIPSLLDDIMEHPVRWATLAALTYALPDQISRQLSGAMDEKDLPPNRRMNKALGYLLPGAMQVDAAVVPAMKALGLKPDPNSKYTIDVARFTPLSALTGSPVPGSAATQISDQLPGVLQPGGPVMDLASIAAGRDAFTGDPILSEGERQYMSPGRKALEYGKQGLRVVAPSFAGFHIPRVLQDMQNKDYDKAAIDALGVVGARPTAVVKGRQAQREARDMSKAMRELQMNLQYDLRDAQNNPARQKALRQRAMEDLARLRDRRREQLRNP